jgi:predicted glutamine amidotransferase
LCFIFTRCFDDEESSNKMTIHNHFGVNDPKLRLAPFRFGCRLSVYMSSDGVDPALSRSCLDAALLSNDNALKSQAKKRLKGHPLSSEFCLTPQDEVQLRAKEGNQDGWGIANLDASFDSSGQWQVCGKSLMSADVDPGFDVAGQLAMGATAPQKGRTVLAHLLKSPYDREPNLNNLHPFQVGQWIGMLNGSMRGFLKDLRQTVRDRYEALLGQSVKGSTASELALHYFVGKLKEQYGTSNFSVIGTEQVRKTFVSVLTEIRDKALENQDQMLPGKKVGLNFVMSDGDHTLGYRYGRSLFVATRVNPETGKIQEAFLTSEPLKQEGAVAGFQWQEVPENHFVYLDRVVEKGSTHLNVEMKPNSQSV